MRDKMRDIMEHVLKLYSYLYGTCNRHSRLTEGRRRLSSYSFDDQKEFQSSRYPNSLWLLYIIIIMWNSTLLLLSLVESGTTWKNRQECSQPGNIFFRWHSLWFPQCVSSLLTYYLCCIKNVVPIEI